MEVDFSLLNDPAYYNGVIFQGYIEKFPRAVLSGGRYDNLVKKFGAGSGGAGFALYPDELGLYYGGQSDVDCDCLLLYSEVTPSEDVLQSVRSLISQGKRVCALPFIPENRTFKEIIRL